MSLPVTVADLDEFDSCGALPTGVTVLEASAGTGKTFTIAALAARYVAEGLPLEHLLLVSFTRMATGELRDRVRERLIRTERGLALACAGAPPDDDDGIVALLAATPRAEIEVRRRRLAAALADFDAATIATTHEFCHHVLNGLGVAGDVDRDVVFVDDPRDLVDEVVADFYVRKFHRGGDPAFDLTEAFRIAHTAVANHDAALEPAGAPPEGVAAMRRRLAEAVRQEVDRRRRLAGVLTYDDLLTRLRDTLADPVRGEVACRRLSDRYRVALVDEFQDTDPVQWEILRRAFAGGGSTLVLIGDPKQAIYAFRGADVHAYLQAAREAGARATLAVNWRSDQALLDAFDALFGGATLGHPEIAYRRVRAAPLNGAPRLSGAPGEALRVRVVHRAGAGVALTPKGWLNAQAARRHVAADLAGDVVRLLSSGAELVEPAQNSGSPASVPLRPGHLAVLVHRHRDAALVREALQAVGVPAVINGAGSVFATPMAAEWLRFLQALERPTAAGAAHAAALTVFLGWPAEQVATASEEAWEDVHARLHRWAGALRRRGVASLIETVASAEGLPARMLARADGERGLTDLRHVGQLLHAVATSEQLGVTALTGWLRQRIADAGTEGDAEDRTRRLDSDAEAVQVLTIHRSKGLEFPVVYCPFLWDPGWIDKAEPPVYHDAGAGGRRTVDVGGPGTGSFLDHRWQHITEKRGEELRLVYVAVTRARHQAVVWWAGTSESGESPLCRLLFCSRGTGGVPVSGDTPEDGAMLQRLAELAEAAPGCISVERSDATDTPGWVGEAGVHDPLEAGGFERTLDQVWRRTSYSAITAGAHGGALATVASEPEDAVMTDEVSPGTFVGPAAGAGTGRRTDGEGGTDGGGGPDPDPEPDPEEARLRAVRSLMEDMPGGVGPGTFVHSVLEAVDFTATALDAELATAIERERARTATDIGEPARVARALEAAIGTPLGPLVEETRLRDIPARDRIDELGFELPLVGGDAPSGDLSVAHVAALLRHHLAPGDALAGYARHLEDPSLEDRLRGYLSGSLDLVFRITGAGGVTRFAVVDYKTNRLGGHGEGLSAWDYRPAALAEAMFRSHYPLQALLYTVALHRYLRWRVPGYSAEANLAGVLYLFVRGMSGPDTPRVEGAPCGVFSWRSPPALVEALSDLLDQGRPA
ncbi:MAG TPA: UvrD-helicase domain-containing protein [Acidimicrobiales bacterium]|nr:UvrD-helicase domain-containing protein [Acidimicrobiales bacterium]